MQAGETEASFFGVRFFGVAEVSCSSLKNFPRPLAFSCSPQSIKKELTKQSPMQDC